MLKKIRFLAPRPGDKAPIEPLGPVGVSADGLLIAASRRASGQVDLYAQHVTAGDLHTGSFSALNPERNELDGELFVGTDGSRLVVAARCVGVATLSPLLESSDPARYGLISSVDILRQLDLGQEAYAVAHPDTEGEPTPIGSLHGGSAVPVPIFPIAAFVDLSALPGNLGV